MDQYFSYFDRSSAASCLAAVNNLERYIAVQGPFDGVIAFSQGCALASTLLVRLARTAGSAVPFKVAIFFSGGVPADPDLLDRGMITPLDYADVGEVIKIPTAHIWGSKDRGESDWPPMLRDLCSKEARAEFKHSGGHEVPGSKDRAAVTGVIRAARRAIWRAEKASNVVSIFE
jgi:pimeloyl-ACP methyl ester carboxylesterase